MKKYSKYLGDAVYVDFDGYQIVLTTGDKLGGEYVENCIYLEPKVYDNLVNYVNELNKDDEND
jgi:hypothetical protein